MPLPMTHNMHIVFFFIPTQLPILPLCKSEFKHMSSRLCGLLLVPQLLSASVYSLPGALFFYLAEVQSSVSWTVATITGLQTVQVLVSQMTPDDFFAHSRRECR